MSLKKDLGNFFGMAYLLIASILTLSGFIVEPVFAFLLSNSYYAVGYTVLCLCLFLTGIMFCWIGDELKN